MMSFLCQSDVWSAYADAPAEFSTRLVLSLGSLLAVPDDELEALAGPWRDEPVLHPALALEWLLARGADPGSKAKRLTARAAARPWGETQPTVRQVAKLKHAAVVVPLLNPRPGDSPRARQLWLFQDPGNIITSDHAGLLDGWQGHPAAQAGCKVLMFPPPVSGEKISGESWTLGAALALRAMRDGAAAVQTLAANWLVTGQTGDGDHVTRVKLGNKLDLARWAGGRTWLFPSANVNELPRGFAPGGGWCATHKVGAAWRLVTGQGAIRLEAEPWPTTVDSLHSFVSTSREPVIGAVLLSRADRVTLWQTDNETVSRRPCEDLVWILGQLRPDLKVDCRNVASHDMVKVESQLRAVLLPELQTGRPVPFNITQGNRLMGFAVHTLARLYPNLWLIYRDNDDTGTDFTAIRYERDQPVTVKLQTAPENLPRIVAWAKLFEPRPPLKVPPIEELLKKITPAGRKAGQAEPCSATTKDEAPA